MREREEITNVENFYELKLTVEQGINVNALLLGFSPNCFVKCEKLEFETNLIYRDSNPNFNFFYTNKILTR